MPKQVVRKVLTAFLVMMIALTLFSNTLLQYTLPQVTLEQPGPGALSHYIDGSGTIAAAEVSDVYADSETRWPVKEVKVKAGDHVAKGDTLAIFDTEAGKNSLADEEDRHRQQQIRLNGLRDNYIAAQRNGDDGQVRALSRDIESARLDMAVQERKIDRLRKQLTGAASLTAPVPGIVVAVNLAAGLTPQGSEPAVSVADSSKPLQLKVILPEEQAKYLSEGDQPDVVVRSLDGTPIKGKISKIRSPTPPQRGQGAQGPQGAQPQTPGDSKELVIDLADERLQGGEYAEFAINKRTKPAQTLVSNAALRDNDGGRYMLILQKRRGVFGDEYYARQIAVVTGDADDSNTEIKSGLGKSEQIIVAGSAPVGDGDRVRLAD